MTPEGHAIQAAVYFTLGLGAGVVIVQLVLELRDVHRERKRNEQLAKSIEQRMKERRAR